MSTPLVPVNPTVVSHVAAGRARLLRAGISNDTSTIDAEVLARETLQWDRAQYLTRRNEPAPDGFAERYAALLTRRETREPVSQILGRREFWGRMFAVTRDVLTPRPETELIVETALELRPAVRTSGLRVVDAGTGSGCLAVTLACEWPDASVVATDVSAPALGVAASNIARHGVAARVHLVRTDFVDALAGGIDLVVSNPPYVPDAARTVLPRDVRDYEPATALFGGPDGFGLIERLLDQVASRLQPLGLLVMEFGAGQDDRVRDVLAVRPALRLVEVRDDLQGIPRVAVVARA